MAQRVQVVLEDDLDGSDAVETVMFGLDGVEYEVDLSSDNAEKFREALSPWIAVGRRTGGRRKRATASARPAEDEGGGASTGKVRAWAQANNHKVSARGRISKEVRVAYDEAHR